MEILEIKEALKTVIMLAETSRKEHIVEIDRIGKVIISKKHGVMQSIKGEEMQIKRETLRQCLDELLSESYEAKVKRRVSEMIFG